MRDCTRIYLGSYSSDGGDGLAVAAADLTDPTPIAGVPDASWLALSPDRRIVYATNESDDGTVTAVRRTDHQVLGRQSSLGRSPAHLTVHPSGRYLLTANYGSGGIVVHPIAEDGGIGAATDLVTHPTGAEPHAHQVVVDPSGQWVLAVDIGADVVSIRRLDVGTGKLESHDHRAIPSGTGPRHLTFHPDGTRGYLIAEYRSTIFPFTWDAADGRIDLGTPVSTRPPGRTGENYPGEVAVSGDGRFCYAGNRGDNSIATFAVEDTGLRLLDTVPTGGDWPRHFALDPAERRMLVANQRSGTVTVLERDLDTGLLSPTEMSLDVPAVAMVMFA